MRKKDEEPGTVDSATNLTEAKIIAQSIQAAQKKVTFFTTVRENEPDALQHELLAHIAGDDGNFAHRPIFLPQPESRAGEATALLTIVQFEENSPELPESIRTILRTVLEVAEVVDPSSEQGYNAIRNAWLEVFKASRAILPEYASFDLESVDGMKCYPASPVDILI